MQTVSSFKKLLLFVGSFFILNFITAQISSNYDTLKSQKAISCALNYIRLINEKNLDSVILLSDVQFKRVSKFSWKTDEIKVFKTLEELKNSLKTDFESSVKRTLLNVDTVFINHINKGGKKKIKYDEVYFVMVVSRYFSKESNIEKKLKSQLVVRMENFPKVIGLIEE